MTVTGGRGDSDHLLLKGLKGHIAPLDLVDGPG